MVLHRPLENLLHLVAVRIFWEVLGRHRLWSAHAIGQTIQPHVELHQVNVVYVDPDTNVPIKGRRVRNPTQSAATVNSCHNEWWARITARQAASPRMNR